MKKLFTILVAICFMISTSSCGIFAIPNAQQSGALIFNGLVVAQNAVTIYSQYLPVANIIASRIDKMDKDDVDALVDIKTNYDKIYNEFVNLQSGKTNIREIAVDYITFYNMFSQLEGDYLKVVKIINKYTNVFTQREMVKLISFENACVSLNNEFINLNEQILKNDKTAKIATDITKLLQDTLVIANAISTIAMLIPK